VNHVADGMNDVYGEKADVSWRARSFVGEIKEAAARRLSAFEPFHSTLYSRSSSLGLLLRSFGLLLATGQSHRDVDSLQPVSPEKEWIHGMDEADRRSMIGRTTNRGVSELAGRNC